MSLGSERRRFSKMISLLTHYIEFLGLDWADDMGKRCKECPVGHPKSTHKSGLARDILLYGPAGEYPHPSWESEYNQLHDFWDFIGGAKRIDDDLNHFSLEWQGVR
ncbi:hypothetical protein N9937_01275 [bacterium]|nr:hypothetical protein [bacterium]